MSLSLVCLLTIAVTTEHELKRFEATELHMGSKFAIAVYAVGQQAADASFKAAFARVSELNRMMSDYDSASELSRLSASAPTKIPIEPSAELFLVLKHAQQLSAQTDGAFDVTVGPLTKLWRRARRQKRLPNSARLTDAKTAVGYEKLKLDPEGKQVELLAPGMRLDLGGIAKGYAADEALRVIRSHGISRVLINAGGDVVLGDAPPNKNGWKIGIAALEPEAAPSRFLTLTNCSVATSGDTWQYVEIDGRRYSHILDPHTGLGLTTRSSVTIVAPTGMQADSLASAVSVLGPKKGFALLDKFKDVAGLVIEKEATGIRSHQSRYFPSD